MIIRRFTKLPEISKKHPKMLSPKKLKKTLKISLMKELLMPRSKSPYKNLWMLLKNLMFKKLNWTWKLPLNRLSNRWKATNQPSKSSKKKKIQLKKPRKLWNMVIMMKLLNSLEMFRNRLKNKTLLKPVKISPSWDISLPNKLLKEIMLKLQELLLLWLELMFLKLVMRTGENLFKNFQFKLTTKIGLPLIPF